MNSISRQSFASLVERKRLLSIHRPVMIHDEHPESGAEVSVILTSKDGFFSVDGIAQTVSRMVSDSNGNQYPIASPASFAVAAENALVKLAEKWSAEARRFCAWQDDCFLRATGQLTGD